MDRDFLRINGLNPNGDLFKATKDGACLYALNELDSKWEKKTNKKNNRKNEKKNKMNICSCSSVARTCMKKAISKKVFHNYPMVLLLGTSTK